MYATHVNDMYSSLEFQLSLLKLSSALERKTVGEEAEDRKLEVLLRQQRLPDPA